MLINPLHLCCLENKDNFSLHILDLGSMAFNSLLVFHSTPHDKWCTIPGKVAGQSWSADLFLSGPKDDLEESGWKMVSGDVFRTPQDAILLCVLVGSGVQIIASATLTLFFAALGEHLLIYPWRAPVSGRSITEMLHLDLCNPEVYWSIEFPQCPWQNPPMCQGQSIDFIAPQGFAANIRI